MTPRISLLVGWVADPEPLRRTVESALRQDCDSWEVLVLHTDAPALEEPSDAGPAPDERVRHLHLGAGTTSDAAVALEAGRTAAHGEMVGVLAAGDELEPGALAAALMVLDADPALDLVYTDEQWPAPGAEGIATKPDWSPHYLQSYPYLGRLCLVRASVLERAGGFRPGFEGAEEWDLALRVAELTDRIGHVPAVAISRPVPPRHDRVAVESGLRAARGVLERAGREGAVEETSEPRGVRLWWSVEPRPLVSLIVPTAGGRRTVRGEDSLLVERCLQSVLERTTYDAWEVVLVTSPQIPDDVVPRLTELLGDRLRVAPVEGPFNFSASVNEGARLAEGELLLLLNDDTEVIEPRWLERMVSVCQGPGVGVVGARLLFENDTIQHVGVIFDDGMSPIHALGSEVRDNGRFGSKVLDLDYPAVTGACLLTPAEVFVEVGGFCIDLPLNFNDIDYCFKVAATGRGVVSAGFAELYHYESSTRGHATEPAEFDFLDRHWGVRRTLDQHVHYRHVL